MIVCDRLNGNFEYNTQILNMREEMGLLMRNVLKRNMVPDSCPYLKKENQFFDIFELDEWFLTKKTKKVF